MELIAPTTALSKEGDKYTLEDKDYLMIRAIQELAQAISKLTLTISNK